MEENFIFEKIQNILYIFHKVQRVIHKIKKFDKKHKWSLTTRKEDSSNFKKIRGCNIKILWDYSDTSMCFLSFCSDVENTLTRKMDKW